MTSVMNVNFPYRVFMLRRSIAQRRMPAGFVKDKNKERMIFTAGLNFKPLTNVVIKADYRNRVAKRGGLADELNFGVGLVF